MIVVVGAGLAGLACARTLRNAGREFLLLEAESEPGGRIRSHHRGGFTIDRGFQVVLDSYGALREQADIGALEPRYFDSGALIWEQGKFFQLLNPLRHPSASVAALITEALPMSDKLALARLGTETFLVSDKAFGEKLAHPDPASTRDFLRQQSFSEVAIRRFFRPFFGGVFLDAELGASADLFRFYLKKFAAGLAFVPAEGAGALPRQLASTLPGQSILYRTRVESLEIKDGRVAALHLSSGEKLPVEQVILATEEPATAKLLGTACVRGHTSSVTVYLRSRTSLYPDKLLVLPVGEGRLMQHFVQITNVAPEYAPAGEFLVSATVVKPQSLDDEALIRAVTDEIGEIFPGHALKPLEVVRVPYSTVRTEAARPVSPYPNLWLAGDQVASSNLEAVLRSGEQIAYKVLAQG